MEGCGSGSDRINFVYSWKDVDPDPGGLKTYRFRYGTLLLRPIEVYFSCKNLLFMMEIFHQDPDPHRNQC
jgi:hypothetical protein